MSYKNSWFKRERERENLKIVDSYPLIFFKNPFKNPLLKSFKKTATYIL